MLPTLSVLPPGSASGGVDSEALANLTARAMRLGGLAHCFYLAREGAHLVEIPARDDGLRLPLANTFSGSVVGTCRAQVASLGEDLLHPRERSFLRTHGADHWLVVPVVDEVQGQEVSGLVVGLKKGPLGPETGGVERSLLALVAEQIGLHRRNHALEQWVASARGRAREAEGEIEGLLQSLRTPALLLTPDNHIHLANRAAELLFSFSLAEARGRPVREAVAIPAIAEILEQVSSTGGGQLPEVRVGEGLKVVLEVRIAPVFDGKGELRRRVVVFNDTTLLRQADELKTEFVSMISHELRTPLTSIKAFASTLLRDEVGSVEDQHEWLEIIDRECDRLSALINDLLTISRLESGQRLPMHFAEVDLVPLLGEVIEAQRALATRHTFALAAPPRAVIECDEDKIRQVFANLINNAVKYSPRGGEVVVALGEGGAEVEVRVKDQGVGIRPEHLNLIFDKFFQVDGSSTRRVGGTGLGLYLTRRLVEEHGGTIWCESEPGVGSEFVVTLRRRRHALDRLGT